MKFILIESTKVIGDTFIRRTLYQMEQYALLNSIHNEIDDSCCPDMSCCNFPDVITLKCKQEHLNVIQKEREEWVLEVRRKMRNVKESNIIIRRKKKSYGK